MPFLRDLAKLFTSSGPVNVEIARQFAQWAMGQYDLPIPRPAADSLMVVPSTVDAFAEDWSLPPDDVRLWVCVTELTLQAVLSRPHVRDRLQELLLEYAGAFEPDSAAL